MFGNHLGQTVLNLLLGSLLGPGRLPFPPGDGFEPKPRYDGQSEESGWGLYLVDTISDRWGVGRAGGTNVWFEIDGRSAPQLL